MPLNQKDITAISNLVKHEIESQVKPLTEKIDQLPTKDEFLASQDELMTELQTTRQEQSSLNKRVSRLESHPIISTN